MALEPQKVNLIAYIRRRMEEENITLYKLAKYLGCERSNLTAAMKGRIPMPLSRVETILWILDGYKYLCLTSK